jgi:hypothetical protein
VAVAEPPIQSPQLMNQPNDDAAAKVRVPLCEFAPAGFDSWIRVESTMTPKGSPPGPPVSDVRYDQLKEYIPGMLIVTWS